MISRSVPNLKPGWIISRGQSLLAAIKFDWGPTLASSRDRPDRSEKTAGLDSIILSWPAVTWQENPESGVSTIYTQLWVGQGVQPDSGHVRTRTRTHTHVHARSHSRSHTHTHTLKYTPARVRVRACEPAEPTSAFLPVSCRGGSAHVHCWLSNLSNWWTPAPIKNRATTCQFNIKLRLRFIWHF